MNGLYFVKKRKKEENYITLGDMTSIFATFKSLEIQAKINELKNNSI